MYHKHVPKTKERVLRDGLRGEGGKGKGMKNGVKTCCVQVAAPHKEYNHCVQQT